MRKWGRNVEGESRCMTGALGGSGSTGVPRSKEPTVRSYGVAVSYKRGTPAGYMGRARQAKVDCLDCYQGFGIMFLVAWVWSLGFGGWGFGFGFWGLEFGLWGWALGLRIVRFRGWG